MIESAWEEIWFAVGSIILFFLSLAFPFLGAVLGLLLSAADIIVGLVSEFNTMLMVSEMNEQAKRIRHGSKCRLTKDKIIDSIIAKMKKKLFFGFF